MRVLYVGLEDADDEEHASDRPARPLSAAHVPFEIESGSHGVHQAKPANEGGH
jgi:cytochrome d ubiquinol oxidase subunit I